MAITQSQINELRRIFRLYNIDIIQYNGQYVRINDDDSYSVTAHSQPPTRALERYVLPDLRASTVTRIAREVADRRARGTETQHAYKSMEEERREVRQQAEDDAFTGGIFGSVVDIVSSVISDSFSNDSGGGSGYDGGGGESGGGGSSGDF